MAFFLIKGDDRDIGGDKKPFGCSFVCPDDEDEDARDINGVER